MQFLLSLSCQRILQQIPINYQYPLSAAIYRILERADSEYAAFLHDAGYRQEDSLKSFKLFSFSDLKTPFKIIGDRIQLLTRQAELVVSFHLPHAAETFIKGLFQQQQLELADSRSRMTFSVDQVTALPLHIANVGKQELILEQMSPVIAGLKNEKRNYTFLPPDHPEFIPQLMYNWKEKYSTMYGAEEADCDFEHNSLKVLFNSSPPKSRLIIIKANTSAETKIRGFVNFRLEATGTRDALELLVNAGVGIYNSLGMGSVRVARQQVVS